MVQCLIFIYSKGKDPQNSYCQWAVNQKGGGLQHKLLIILKLRKQLFISDTTSPSYPDITANFQMDRSSQLASLNKWHQFLVKLQQTIFFVERRNYVIASPFWGIYDNTFVFTSLISGLFNSLFWRWFPSPEVFLMLSSIRFSLNSSKNTLKYWF